jgi:hypothetical protein
MSGSYITVLKKKDPNFKFIIKDFEKWVLDKKNLSLYSKECGVEEKEIIDIIKYFKEIECSKIKDSFCNHGDVGLYHILVSCIIPDYLLKNNLAIEDGNIELYSCDDLLILR